MTLEYVLQKMQFAENMERKGHLQRACRSKKKILSINETTEQPHRSSFLGVISDSKEPCSVTLRLNGRSTFLCIDTDAEVTVISEKAYAKIISPELKTMDKTLKGPSGGQLACNGQFMGYLQKGDRTIKEEIYVIKNLCSSLDDLIWLFTCV